MVLLVIIGLALVTVLSLTYLALTVYLLEDDAIAIRLRAINGFVQGRSNIDAALARPFKQRIVFPRIGEIASRLNRFTPRAIRRLAEEKMRMDSGFCGRNPRKVLLLSGVLACGLPVIIVMLMNHIGAPAQKIIGLAISIVSVGFYIPFLLINRKILLRKTSMQKALPDVLDLLTVSIEAGLEFDEALAKLVEQIQGPLVDEFTRSLQDIQMGLPRREALQAMGARCGVDDLSLLITSLIQADQSGESIGKVLRVQAAAIREQRRPRAEGKAQMVLAKILFLIVLWIVSAIIVVQLVRR
jgi:tight adherence protein C